MEYEVAIIGGSSAGLAAALTMGRSERKTIVFDTARPRNKPAAHAHNIFTRDGIPPLELLKIGREQLLPYTSVSLSNKKVIRIRLEESLFIISTEDKEKITAKRIILATGLVDILPEIKGFKELWGNKIIHCPYCHGWEVKNEPVGLLMNGPALQHMAIMVQHWNKNIRVFTNGPIDVEQENKNWMDAMGIEIIETPVIELIDAEEGVIVSLDNGLKIPVTALYSKPVRLHFNNELAVQLGCNITDDGSVVVDEVQLTSVPGVFAAGDLAHPMMHQVALAAAAGLKAALNCNNSLIMEAYERSK